MGKERFTGKRVSSRGMYIRNNADILTLYDIALKEGKNEASRYN